MPESVTKLFVKRELYIFWILFRMNWKSLINVFKEQSTKTSTFACLADCNDRKRSCYADNKGNVLQKGRND